MAGITDALGQKAFAVRDMHGKEHLIPCMTFGDARDLEKVMGRSMSDMGGVLDSFEGQIKILWVIVRREGMTRAAVRDARASGKWPMSEEDVGDLFELTQAVEVFRAMTSALRQGGVEVAKDPTPAGAPDGGAPATTTTPG